MSFHEAFFIHQKIMNASGPKEAMHLYITNKRHPITLYGLVDYLLLNEGELQDIQFAQTEVLYWIRNPIDTNQNELNAINDCIGQIMLKPLLIWKIQFPIGIDTGVQENLNWILIGFKHLQICCLNMGIDAHDSHLTIGSVFEEYMEDLAFLICGNYLDYKEYSVNFNLLMTSYFLKSLKGFKKDREYCSEIDDLNGRSSHYLNWLKEKNPNLTEQTVITLGENISNQLSHKIETDKYLQSNLSHLKPRI